MTAMHGENLGRLLRAREVAGLLGLSIQHIYLMAKRRILPSIKFGEGKGYSVRFPERDLLEFVERNRRRVCHNAPAPVPEWDR